MQLKEFSLISPVIESETVLKALETAIPKEAIEKAMPAAGYSASQTHTVMKNGSELYRHMPF
jgi:hypothetical protein